MDLNAVDGEGNEFCRDFEYPFINSLRGPFLTLTSRSSKDNIWRNLN
jgi:hypothetical protein